MWLTVLVYTVTHQWWFQHFSHWTYGRTHVSQKSAVQNQMSHTWKPCRCEFNNTNKIILVWYWVRNANILRNIAVCPVCFKMLLSVCLHFFLFPRFCTGSEQFWSLGEVRCFHENLSRRLNSDTVSWLQHLLHHITVSTGSENIHPHGRSLRFDWLWSQLWTTYNRTSENIILSSGDPVDWFPNNSTSHL